MGEPSADQECTSSRLFAELPTDNLDTFPPLAEGRYHKESQPKSSHDDYHDYDYLPPVECDPDRSDINDNCARNAHGGDVVVAVGPDASVRYDRRKPKWWKQRVGRYVTKSQRRALEAMQEYRFGKPPHGHVLDFDAMFANSGNPPDATPQDGDICALSVPTATALTRRRIWMEIGFGKGDNLLCLAERNPHIGFVGAEVHPSSVAICLQRMQASVERREFWSEYELYDDKTNDDPCLCPCISEQNLGCGERASVVKPLDQAAIVYDASRLREESSPDSLIDAANQQPEAGRESDSPASTLPYQNVRVYGGDAIVLLENCVESGSLDAILITFPDPFPSDKPHRILQVHTVETMYRTLATRGRLYVATDHPIFYEWSLRTMERWNALQQELQSSSDSAPSSSRTLQRRKMTPILGVNRIQWLPVVSRYERKGWDEGRTTHLACWEKSYLDPTNEDPPPPAASR
jgi:tRNA G46 methylase TrmB